MSLTTGFARDLASRKEQEIANLTRQVDELIQKRKDMGRFIDIDLEKKEQESLKKEITKLYADRERIISETNETAKAILDKAHQNAYEITESALKAANQVEQKSAEIKNEAERILRKVNDERKAVEEIKKEAIHRSNELMDYQDQLIKEELNIEYLGEQIYQIVKKLPKLKSR